MIPLRDNNPRRTVPFITFTLIVINVLMFLWELSLGRLASGEIASVAFIPNRFWLPGHFEFDLFTIVFSMFLHGGWLHLLGNMLYLWIFGDNVEDAIGHVRYLIFYLLCGTLATFSHALISPASSIPAIGASGAIAGVLGAYLILYPRARVLTLIPLGFFMFLREVPAVFILGFWFVIQFFTGVLSIGVRTADQGGGIAYFAHIGGFLAGIVLVNLLGGTTRKPKRLPGW